MGIQGRVPKYKDCIRTSFCSGSEHGIDIVGIAKVQVAKVDLVGSGGEDGLS